MNKILILTEEDVDDYQLAQGCMLKILFVPESKRSEFKKSKAYTALFPCVHRHGKILYYSE